MSSISDAELFGISEMIDKFNISSIIGPTGIGKTLFIPTFYANKNTHKKIIVSVPTIPAAELASKQASEISKNKGYPIIIGYAAGGKRKNIESANVLYATAGYVRNYLFKLLKIIPRNINNVTIFLDEVHVQSIDNSMVNAFSMIMTEYGENVSLVTMTATKLYNNILGIIPETIIESKSKYRIVNKFLTNPVNRNRINESVISVLKNFLKGKMNVLVFVAGIKDAIKLTNLISGTYKDYIVVSLHSKSTTQDINIANSPAPRPKLGKIIVATNVVESSVTIPDVSLIIDSMYEKVPAKDERASSTLRLQKISYISSLQRRGRTGRTSDGIYYPLVTYNEYEKLKIAKQPIPDIKILPIDKEILQLKLIGVQNVENYLDIDRGIINDVGKRMIKYGILENGQYTDFAYFFSGGPPLHIKQSRFLWEWKKLEHPIYWGCVMAMFLEGNPESIIENDSKLLIKKGPDQLSTLLNLWIQFERDARESPERKKSKSFMELWCLNNKCVYKSLSISVKLLSSILAYENVDDKNILDIDAEKIVRLSVPILKNIYVDSILKKEGRNYVFVSDDRKMKEYLKLSSGIGKTLIWNDNIIALNNVYFTDRQDDNQEILNNPKKAKSSGIRIITLYTYAIFDIKRYAAKNNIKQIAVELEKELSKKPSDKKEDIFQYNFLREVDSDDVGIIYQIPAPMRVNYLLNKLSIDKVETIRYDDIFYMSDGSDYSIK